MTINHPEQIETGLPKSQKIIALNYLNHLCAKINTEGSISEYIGYRNHNQFEGIDGLRIDQYPYEHKGNSIAIGFKLFDDVWIELINDTNYYVLYVQCQMTDGNTSSFLYEFEKDDSDFLDLVSEDISKALNGEDTFG